MIGERSLSKLLIAGLLLSFAAAPALADEDSGFYAGAGVGKFGLKLDADDLDLDDFDFDDDASSFKVFAGWRFNKFLSAELDYLDLGTPEETFTDGISTADLGIGVNGFAPYAIATLPVGFFEVFAKLGYLFYDVEISVHETGSPPFSASESDEGMIYGGGIGFVFFGRLNIRAEYETYDVGDVDRSDAFWLTAAWRF